MKLDLTSLLSRSIRDSKLFVLLFFIVVSLISCTEENSESLPDGTQIMQDYYVLFSDKNPTLAYALFQKKDATSFSEIKLTGEQSIAANDKEMKYHYLDDNTVLGYSYSIDLGESDEVIFGFKRYKDKMIYNKVNKSEVMSFTLPDDLSEITNGKEVKWNGSVKLTGENMEFYLDTNKKGYSVHYGDISKTNDGFVFEGVPTGKYTLTIKRYVTIDTKENDGDAKGNITIAYYDRKDITVK